MKTNKLEGDALLRFLQAEVGPYDGHTHSIVSDGKETLLGLARMAAEAGIKHLAITDHDNALHPRKARILSLQSGIDVIPGVEENVEYEVKGKRILPHLGLLWVPNDDVELNALLQRNLDLDWKEYPMALLRNLYALGLDPSGEGPEKSYEMLEERNPQCKYLAKGAVADLLVDTGLVSSRREVSQLYLGEHGERRAYVDKLELFRLITMEELLRCVTQLNKERDTAVVVTFNHPFHYGLDIDTLEQAVADFARWGGHALEVYYPKHDRARENLLLGWCEKYGLVPNVGSDYHYDAHNLALGDAGIFETLLRIHKKDYQPEGKDWF